MIEENSIVRAQKMLKDCQNTYQKKSMKYLLTELSKPVKTDCLSCYW